MGIGIVSTTVAAAVALIVSRAVSNVEPGGRSLILEVALWSTYINSAVLLGFQAFIGLGAFRLYNGAQIATPLAYLLLLGVTAALGLLTPETAVLAMIAAGFFTTILVLRHVLAHLPLRTPTRAEMVDLVSYAARAAPTDVSMTLTSYLDKVILIALTSPRQLGLYVVAYSASRILLVLGPAINSVVFAHMAQRSRPEINVLHDRCLRFALHAFLFGIPLLFLIDRGLLSGVYGADFSDAAPVFRLLALEAALTCLAHFTTQAHMALGRPGCVSLIQMASLSLLAAGLPLAVPAFGIMGAAGVLLAAAALRLALLFVSAKYALCFSTPRLVLRGEDVRFLWNRLNARSIAAS